METKFTCDDKALLVSYLYDEVDHHERIAIEEHLKRCGPCESEVAALRSVRTELSTWAPPDAALGFTMVRTGGDEAAAASPARVLRPARWWHTAPVWAQAAAAVLVLAVGLAIANVQV